MLFTGFNEALYMKDDGTQGKVKRYNSAARDDLIEGQQLWLSSTLHGAGAATAEFYADVDEDMVEDNNDDDDNNNDDDASSNNDMLELGGLRAISHTTRPPNRFSEASFIKELETIGVGRPSTYSKVIETLRSAERKYVVVEGKSLIPTITGLIVNDFLQNHFPDLT